MSLVYNEPIRAVIFDNDGTLMNTEWVYSVAHKECTGSELTWDLKIHLMGKTPIEACRITCEALNLTESPESLCERRTKMVEEYWPTIPMMPGAESLIDELHKRNIRMAIATASNHKGFDQKSSGHRDVIAKMDHVICGDDVKNGKPEPDLFLAALGKWDGIDAKNALVFEDSPLGIAAANRAGMPAVFVPDPHMDAEAALKEYDAHPVLIINSLENFNYDLFKWA
ncbi:haloacid dehalogenase-like hydrolase family protein [Tritrichomonas foetus]|uniref:Haloacid dehalogenase-like hydrolase family protein n=1 Tax=Tritrichomonas foetus TaxID=1144522 RepID=A0A1J4KQX2_9EUKA|nr:haloacid dehalogenase-like hydrolase family protein [Tritrichomonas foetus]|eukprot:OHT11869.1 haloacid dehalogenase-like hydrolase family protein [Tritrichomonas foetus]